MLTFVLVISTVCLVVYGIVRIVQSVFEVIKSNDAERAGNMDAALDHREEARVIASRASLLFLLSYIVLFITVMPKSWPF